MQHQLRSADSKDFPDQSSFLNLKATGSLTSPEDAANRVLVVLMREDFGAHPVADVRD
jgi:benzil reductase ((S)-benzoin forming)